MEVDKEPTAVVKGKMMLQHLCMALNLKCQRMEKNLMILVWIFLNNVYCNQLIKEPPSSRRKWKVWCWENESFSQCKLRLSKRTKCWLLNMKGIFSVILTSMEKKSTQRKGNWPLHYCKVHDCLEDMWYQVGLQRTSSSPNRSGTCNLLLSNQNVITTACASL